MEKIVDVDRDEGQTSGSQLSIETRPSAIIVQDGRVVNPALDSGSATVVANHCGELENDVNRLLEVVHGCITGKGLMHSGEPDAGGARVRPPEHAPPEVVAESSAAASDTQNDNDQSPGYVEASPDMSRALAPQHPPEQEELVQMSGFLGPWYAIERLCSDLVQLNHIADNLDGIMLQTLSCFRPKHPDTPSAKSARGPAPPSGAKRHKRGRARSCKCDKRRLEAEREFGNVADLLPPDGGMCRHSEVPDEMPLEDPACNCRHCVGGEVVERVAVTEENVGVLGREDERRGNCSLNIVNETT